MAATAALYSTSPPTAVFSSPRHSVSSDSDIDLSRRLPGNQNGNHSVRGGLSSLFAGTHGRSFSHASPSHGDGCDFSTSCSTSGSSFSNAHLEGGMLCSSRESLDRAVSIPCNSTLRFKDKSPASVLYGFGSSKTSSSTPAPLSGWESSHGHSHASTTGLPPLQRPQFPAERPIQSTPADRSYFGGLRGPELRSVGFQLGNDGDHELDFKCNYRSHTDRSDAAPFSTYSAWTKQSEGDVAVRSVEELTSGTTFEFLTSAHGSPLDTAPTLPELGECELQQFRRKFTKLAERSPATHGREGNGQEKDIMVQIADDQELLLHSQSVHSIFYDPLVKKAFNVAASAHQGQVRKDGKPVLTHCVETATILVHCGLDKTVVAAGLLHDVLDDSMMNEQQLRSIFGDEVSDLVVGVSKLSKFSQLARCNATPVSSAEASKMRNMFLAMADYRVVLIKLADRLHNLRTLGALPFVKQQRIAKESLEIFAPLANRLGIWSWKAEIEDLCFKHLHPTEHDKLVTLLEEGKGKEVVMASVARLDAALKAAGVQIQDLSGRPKNLYSVYCKMEKKGRKVNEIFDLRGLRVIVPDEESCYAALNTVHSMWKPSGSKHFKDYIRNPKDNGYQSLHTVVEVESGHLVEVQIRTGEMHQQAEFGLAAHWQYKEGDADNSASIRDKVAWARFTLSWVTEASLLENKVRLSPADSSLRPPCPFPSHREDCCVGGEGGFCFAASLAADADPLYVIVHENEGISVRELPGGSTVTAMIDELRQDEERYGSQILKLLVNHDVVEDLDLRLRMGDEIEIVAEADELADLESSLPQLLPLHALSHMRSSSPHPEPSIDEMLEEFRRLKSNTWFARTR